MQPSLLQFPKGAISGQQLVDAARRLVMKSLRVTTEKNGCGDQNTQLLPCSTASTVLELPLHRSSGHVNELCRVVPPHKPALPGNSLTNIVVATSPRTKNSPRTARRQLKWKQRNNKKVTDIYLISSLFIISLHWRA